MHRRTADAPGVSARVLEPKGAVADPRRLPPAAGEVISGLATTATVRRLLPMDDVGEYQVPRQSRCRRPSAAASGKSASGCVSAIVRSSSLFGRQRTHGSGCRKSHSRSCAATRLSSARRSLPPGPAGRRRVMNSKDFEQAPCRLDVVLIAGLVECDEDVIGEAAFCRSPSVRHPCSVS